MTLLVLGLILFVAVHLVPALPDLRARLHARLGEGAYKGLYSLTALAGLVLMVIGFSRAPVEQVWDPPIWLRHINLTLMIFAMILIVAAYVPGRIKAKVRHPMVLAVKLWAFGHLLANGNSRDIVLFGGILVWAIVDRISLARRERAGLVTVAGGPARNDLIAIVIGLILYAAFFWKLHLWAFGVPVI
ncbi:MAG: NnrU family protein [Hyphomicrobiales bacterium]|nr:NnrU family protein [Hyphomicrobiales bacterium]